MAVLNVPLGPNYVLSTGTTGVSSKAVTLPQTVKAGNYIIVAGAGWRATSPNPFTVADDQGSSYTVINTQDISWSSGLSCGFVAYAKAASDATYVITVTPAGSTTFISFGAMELENVHQTTPIDVNATEATGTSATPSLAITTTLVNTVIFGLVTAASPADATAWTDASNQYSFLNDQSNLNAPWALAFKRAASAGAATVDWTRSIREWRAVGFSMAPDVSDDTISGAAAITLADTTLASAGTFTPQGGAGFGAAVTTHRYHRMTLGG